MAPGMPWVMLLCLKTRRTRKEKNIMIAFVPFFAAAGYSLIYLLFGGGLGGAILIFIIAKMLGK